MAEQLRITLIIQLLHWEQAFDRIHHDRMAIALEVIGSRTVCTFVHDLYMKG